MASLLRRRRRRDDREDEAEGSRTDLIGAAAGGHTDTVTALLAAPGLAVTAADGAGWTALMLAVAGWRPHRSHTGAATAVGAAAGLGRDRERKRGKVPYRPAAAVSWYLAVSRKLDNWNW